MSKEFGPIWQLQQNLKHHESNARSWREDAMRFLAKAEEADLQAEEYRKAIRLLNKPEVNNPQEVVS